MSDRIQTLVKRISDTRPVQSARRQALMSELRSLRNDLDADSVPDQARGLDAALLLMEFMERSQEVANAETLQIVASLVAAIDEHCVRPRASAPAAARPSEGHATAPTTLDDLRMTEECLLGSILLQAGVVSPESLSRGLQLHASSGLPLGQCLVQLGHTTPEQISWAIRYQDDLREDARRSEGAARGPAAHAPVHSQQQHASPLELRLSSEQRGFAHSMHAQVLGEILVRQGVIDSRKLEKALQLKRAADLHLGEALVQLGFATWAQVKRGLEAQRGFRRSA